MKKSFSSSFPHAFTLVELLTVIAILAILAAILIPVVGKVRAHTDLMECTNNMRQVGMTVQLYTQDHDGVLPGPLRGGQDSRYPWNESNSQQLVYYLAQYAKLNLTDETPSRAKAMVCPAFVGEIDDTNARCYEVRIAKLLMVDSTLQAPFGYPSDDPQNAADPPKLLSKIAEPAKEWMMHDLDQIGTPGYAGNSLAPKTPVHGGVRNTLFFDGHVEALDAAL